MPNLLLLVLAHAVELVQVCASALVIPDAVDVPDVKDADRHATAIVVHLVVLDAHLVAKQLHREHATVVQADVVVTAADLVPEDVILDVLVPVILVVLDVREAVAVDVVAAVLILVMDVADAENHVPMIAVLLVVELVLTERVKPALALLLVKVDAVDLVRGVMDAVDANPVVAVPVPGAANLVVDLVNRLATIIVEVVVILDVREPVMQDVMDVRDVRVLAAVVLRPAVQNVVLAPVRAVAVAAVLVMEGVVDVRGATLLVPVGVIILVSLIVAATVMVTAKINASDHVSQVAIPIALVLPLVQP